MQQMVIMCQATEECLKRLTQAFAQNACPELKIFALLVMPVPNYIKAGECLMQLNDPWAATYRLSDVLNARGLEQVTIDRYCMEEDEMGNMVADRV